MERWLSETCSALMGDHADCPEGNCFLPHLSRNDCPGQGIHVSEICALIVESRKPCRPELLRLPRPAFLHATLGTPWTPCSQVFSSTKAQSPASILDVVSVLCVGRPLFCVRFQFLAGAPGVTLEILTQGSLLLPLLCSFHCHVLL